MEEPIHVCPNCGKLPFYEDDEYCCKECEWEYNEPQRPKTKAQVIRMDIAPNGDLFVAE